MASVKARLPNTSIDAGKANGTSSYSSMAMSSTSGYRSSSYSFRSNSASSHGEASVAYLITDVAKASEKKASAELGYGVFESISSTSFVNLVEYLGNERLSSLPHKGSKWDKVLMRALFFAERQHGFEKTLKTFGVEDMTAANLAYGYCKLLLELGHENADALEKAFSVLYRYSLEVAALLHRAELLSTTTQIREQLCLMYGNLLTLTSLISIRFYKAAQGTSTSLSLDIYEICGDVMESFRERKIMATDLIWEQQAVVAGVDLEKNVSPKTLNRWLAPFDPIQSTLTQEHTTQLAGQAEFTAMWFQKPLAAFVQGDSKVMAITGHSGSGKTVLSASVAERLQRAMGRKSFSTLYFSINSEIPAATTVITILKSLLSQIFTLRMGNLQAYHAVARAYEACIACSDLKRYADHLWEALESSFKTPLEHARDLVVIVDGLEEMQGGKDAAQAFFERFADIVCEGKNVKLIGLADTLSLPSGINTTHISLTHDKLHEDIHAVLLRRLLRSLQSRPGPEQEQLLERLAKLASGSFVWATLSAELLADTKNTDEFNKSLDELEKSPPTIPDLVSRLVFKRELSSHTRTILGWITAAQRPLSVLEVERLFAGDKVDTEDLSEVRKALKTLDTLLFSTDNIIRFKHRSIHQSVSTLVNSGKINVPNDARGADIVSRGLSYAKAVFAKGEDSAVSVDEYDFAKIERTFREHTLLVYVVRYWVLHLQHLGTSRSPKDLANVLPTGTMLSIFERALWAHELPLSEAIDLFKAALHIRQTALKQPNLAVLQTSINTAVTYERLGRTIEAASYYYLSLKASHSLKNEQLATQLAQIYLSTTETSIETKRTEIMTKREEIYGVLITIFESQYGATSTEVVHMRTMLAQLYEHIQETDRAAAVHEVIHTGQSQTGSRDTTHTRLATEQLSVKLGRTRSHEKIETKKESIFEVDDEDEVEEALDVVQATRLLQAAKTEREFVELWQRISSASRSSHSIDLHEKNIDIATAYSRFLVNHKRSEEASAVLSTVGREYQSSTVVLSDRIVSRLSQTASLLQELGQHAAALSILRSTSQIYQSFKRQETQQSIEISRQISSVETQLIQTTDTSVGHSDILERVYRSSIRDEKAVDGRLIAIAKTLATQYMERFDLEHAIEIIHLLLTRAWPAFLHSPANEVQMPSKYLKEVTEIIVDFLVPCYRQQGRPEKFERALSVLFNAALKAKTVDFTFVNKVQTQLIEHYDKGHLPVQSIATLQRALPIRRAQLGSTHLETITALYSIGRRARERPRLYPGWIDYYQEIVTSLNKNEKICHPQALDALIIVVTTYWEDGRYDAAVHNYTILWHTFVQKPKEYTQFAKIDFAQSLFERYYKCLEHTSASQETLYEITDQYRTTCLTIFGAQSEITVSATLALARIAYSSEQHASRSIDLYEEVSKHAHGSSHYKAEVQSALSTLYTRQVITQTSTSVKSERVESARVRTVEQYQSSVSKFGYTHESTLSSLHQVALLNYKQGKTEAVTKELTKAATEIITKETSSVKLIEAAETLVQTFRATNTVVQAQALITELHRQIVCKDASKSAHSGYDLTKYGRAALPFLAAMMYKTSRDTTASFSQIMADLTVEMLDFEDYRTLVKKNAGLQDILVTASALRAFLVKVKRTEAVIALDSEVASIFVSRDGSKMKLLSQDSAQILMVAIMEYLGTHKKSAFIKAVVVASNQRLVKLITAEQYREAYDISNCAFEFAIENDSYGGPKGISYGFSLAANLAGIGYAKQCSDAALRKQMLSLSNGIARKVLEVCREQKINFTEIQLHELNRLVELLGVQEDYVTLEWLLTSLWSTREAHHDWSALTLHNLGRQLVCVRYLAGHPIKALRLCEDIAYNLKRTNGSSHELTRDMNSLLAQLYTSIGQYYLTQSTKEKSNTDLANQYFAKALAVHSDVLEDLVSESLDGALDDDDDWDSTSAILAEHGISLKGQTQGKINGNADDQSATAKTHLQQLKFAYQRLGHWPRSQYDHDRIIRLVQENFPTATKDISTPEKWQIKGYGGGKAESNEGTFENVGRWRLVEA